MVSYFSFVNSFLQVFLHVVTVHGTVVPLIIYLYVRPDSGAEQAVVRLPQGYFRSGGQFGQQGIGEPVAQPDTLVRDIRFGGFPFTRGCHTHDTRYAFARFRHTACIAGFHKPQHLTVFPLAVEGIEQFCRLPVTEVVDISPRQVALHAMAAPEHEYIVLLTG